MGLIEDDVVTDESRSADAGGLAGIVGSMTSGRHIDLVAVTTGPGSFTGLRASIALAQGLGLGSNVPVVGVTVAEALQAALPQLGRRALWVAIDSRRGRIFLQRGGAPHSVALSDIAEPEGAVAVAGDAAIAVAARLAARGHDVMLTSARRPAPRHIAAIARLRAAGTLPAIPLLPLYVDPPAARESQLRPPPGR